MVEFQADSLRPSPLEADSYNVASRRSVSLLFVGRSSGLYVLALAIPSKALSVTAFLVPFSEVLSLVLTNPQPARINIPVS